MGRLGLSVLIVACLTWAGLCGGTFAAGTKQESLQKSFRSPEEAAQALAAAAKAKTAKSPAKKTKSDKPTTLDKLNRLERDYTEKLLSKAEYDMWKTVYLKEVPFNERETEENYRPRKTRRRAW